VAALVLEALPGILKTPDAPPSDTLILRDADGQVRPSFN
jgi:hypothetical protein